MGIAACNDGQNLLSNENDQGCLGYTGDYTDQFCGDYTKPLRIPIKQPVQWKVRWFFVALLSKGKYNSQFDLRIFLK